MFHPYPKLPESLADVERDETIARRHAKATWVATEKIHGAHLTVWGDGDDLRVAKRRRLLEPGEAFFNHYEAIGPLYAALLTLIENVKSAHRAAAEQGAR